MSRIFISYRREDTAGYNLSLAEPLKRHFGNDQVFMDLDSIRRGLDFRAVIHDAVGSCDALIALIGKNWLTIEDEAGRRRLDNPEDFVRLEVGSALERKDILVIPALVHGAHVPKAAELPDDLKELAYRNAIELRDSSFAYDVGKLIDTLDERLGRRKSRPGFGARLAAWFRGLGALQRTLLAAPLGIVILGVILFAIIHPTPPNIGPAPKMSIVGPAKGKALLKDSLTSAALKTFPTSSGSSTYSTGYQDGAYRMAASNAAKFLATHQIEQTVPGRSTIMNASLAVDGRLVGATANRNLSIYCRYGSNGTGYGLFLYPSGRFFHLDRLDPNSSDILLKGGTSHAIRPDNQWNRLQLSCIGNTITAFVNDKKVAAVQDTHYSGGNFTIGTGVDVAEPDIDARFVNLVETQPASIVVQDTLQDKSGGTFNTYNHLPEYVDRYAKGGYEMDMPDGPLLYASGSPGEFVPVNIGNQTDATITASGRLLSGVSGRYLGLKCRWNAATSSAYVLEIEPLTSGHSAVFLGRFINGKYTSLYANENVAAVNPGNAWNQMSLSCDGANIDATINGSTISEQDSSIPTGEIGVIAGIYRKEPNVDVLFSNLQVNSP